MLTYMKPFMQASVDPSIQECSLWHALWGVYVHLFLKKAGAPPHWMQVSSLHIACNVVHVVASGIQIPISDVLVSMCLILPTTFITMQGSLLKSLFFTSSCLKLLSEFQSMICLFPGPSDQKAILVDDEDDAGQGHLHATMSRELEGASAHMFLSLPRLCCKESLHDISSPHNLLLSFCFFCILGKAMTLTKELMQVPTHVANHACNIIKSKG